jgi:trimeric autotransporter adhesin
MQFNNPASTKNQNMTTLRLIKSMGRSPSRLTLLLIPLVLACFALSHIAQAVVPPPDGGYPGFTTAEGTNALKNLTTGVGNTATGWHSLFANTTGNLNTAVGAGTLLANAGDNNTATGALALLSNTTGTQNTASGAFALFSNTTGDENNANGVSALYYNTIGYGNTASGNRALYQNTEGFYNTANGFRSLFSNQTGIYNTANGMNALWANSSGSVNTANGATALYNNTSGIQNTANGAAALYYNTTGSDNTAIGFNALTDNTTGSRNIALGSFGGTRITGYNNIAIGNDGRPDESDTIRIGSHNHVATYMGGIFSFGSADGVAVYVNSDGKLGTNPSSRRFKKEVKPMDQTSEIILALKPVTFQYKSDGKNTPQFGLIAEEVAAVNPELVVRDQNGDIYSVRYDAVNAMLLNEFLKEHRKNEEQGATITELRCTVAQQQKQI